MGQHDRAAMRIDALLDRRARFEPHRLCLLGHRASNEAFSKAALHAFLCPKHEAAVTVVHAAWMPARR